MARRDLAPRGPRRHKLCGAKLCGSLAVGAPLSPPQKTRALPSPLSAARLCGSTWAREFCGGRGVILNYNKLEVRTRDLARLEQQVDFPNRACQSLSFRWSKSRGSASFLLRQDSCFGQFLRAPCRVRGVWI
ncbi:hypothetical protein MPTK1_5g18140 [Marchantia polymorpha subsp. ruderalis]|uniref:Uncharacterized protein n=2 Tax=Marchantia polymorpha TaxID=3197 RepID=A0AAF6BJL2_MARPO|nr:hypothetical protein MARPO_0084s0061 [Marchantia polymorpha]BBN12196.1 hypothetical protein Mp_5g18140 [Marchantia polymorpha subsp. ruderalis]|eukprot:PTQ33982.1 hypothetical protein MARPO_0084s0061 [Marchantia polymorpha]